VKKISKPERSFYLLAVIAAAGFILRLPSVRLGLPPHIFVDEIFFFDDTYRSLNSAFFFPQAFISGSINELPFWFMGKIFQLFGGGFSYSGFLIFGRILGPLALTALTVFPLYKLSINLTGSRLAATTSVLLFGCSPWVFANSQIWYPDHYIYFFVTMYLLEVSKLWKKQVTSRTVYLLAGYLAVLISVKYSAAIYVVPLMLTPQFITITKKESKEFYSRLVTKALLLSFPIFLVLNFSIFRYFHGFLAGMNSNRRNYRFFTELPLKNFIAYSELTFIFSLGFVGFGLIIFGFIHLRKFHVFLYRLFGITIFAYLFLLSTSPMLFPRNINLLVPLVSVIAGAGAIKVTELHKQRITYAIPVSLVLLSLSAITFASLYSNVNQIRKPDSYELTKSFVSTHVPKSALVGINPGSDGSSPVQEAGFNTIPDPEMSQQLEYYVFNSYWLSPFRSTYYTNGFFGSWSYRDFHFNETSADSAFVISPTNLGVYDLVPNGYRIIRVIDSVGPKFIILRKVDKS
jgi:4-amino-4-deoxy-L-arabinose transferase-like glycosyltransferase